MKIKYERPPLYPKQAAFVDDPSRFTWVEAGTKAGKTIAMIIWIHEQCIMSPGRAKNFWWVSPFYLTSEIAFNRLWEFIPDSIRHLFSRNATHQYITYPGTGHKIWFKTGDKPDTLYGEDVFGAVVDEASRMREASWTALYSTLTATNGRAKIIGNVKGKRNWFYLKAMAAKSDGTGLGYYRLKTTDNPTIDEETIQQARRDLPDAVFRELYECEPSDDGSNPFGVDHIRRNIRSLSTGHPVCFGIDLGKKVDYTVITGLDISGAVCYSERFQADWGQTKEKILRLPPAPILIDATGLGDPVTEDLQRTREEVEGFIFSSKSKQQLMEGLSMGIQTSSVFYPDTYQDELEIFEFMHTRTGVRYSAPDGSHDDMVCSLALAHHKWKDVKHNPVQEVQWSFVNRS
jgi:hypothetical protein